MDRQCPDFINSFLDWTADIPSSTKFLRWTAISTLAAAVGRKTWINYNGIQCYPNIYTMLIGPAGLSKKTTAARHSQKLLKQVPGLNIFSDQLTPAKLLEEMSDFSINTRVFIQGKDYPYGGGFMYAPEAVNLIGRSKFGSMLNILTELYDSDPNGWYMDSPYKKSTIAGGTINIYNPTFNFLGCTTPESLLNQIISTKEIDSGFASRVFFIYEKNVAGKAPVWRESEEEVFANKIEESLVHDLKRISKLTGQFTIAPATRDLQNSFVASNEKKALLEVQSRLRSFYGRKPSHILKLAQIVSLSESSTMRIETKHWEKAKELVEQAESDIFTLFGGVGENAAAPLLYKIWELVRHREDFSMSFVLEKMWHGASRGHILDAIITLANMKRIVATQVGRTVVYKIIDKSPLK